MHSPRAFAKAAPRICPKKGLPGAYLDGSIGGWLVTSMRFLGENAAARFSAILAGSAQDGEERS
jgi:hypothetical protein